MNLDFSLYPFIYIDKIQEEKLFRYMEYTLKVNETLNLTRNDSPETFILKNIIDSLLVADSINLNEKKVLDLGSGAGLPGIPLAIYYPNSNFALLEPTKKRANFLKEVIKLLDLKNVEVVSLRAEEYIKNNRESFDYVLSRAVSKLNILLELSIPFLIKKGILIAYKGINYQEEISESKNALKILNSKILKIDEKELKEINEKRYNIFIQKIEETNLKYPREYRLIKKKAL